MKKIGLVLTVILAMLVLVGLADANAQYYQPGSMYSQPNNQCCIQGYNPGSAYGQSSSRLYNYNSGSAYNPQPQPMPFNYNPGSSYNYQTPGQPVMPGHGRTFPGYYRRGW